MKDFSVSRKSRLLLGLAMTGVSALSACNAQPAKTNIEPDWVHDTAPGTPSPTPGSPSPTPTVIPTSLYSGPESVAPFVAKFVADGLAEGIDVTPDMANPKLTIQIASLDAWGSSVIGLCETGNGQRKVTFDPDFWNRVSETQREILAHHELGHCVLYRPHTSALRSSGDYASIMHPYILAASIYSADRGYYINELFRQASLAARSPEESTTEICTEQDLGVSADE